jgi:hypothetical protein
MNGNAQDELRVAESKGAAIKSALELFCSG